MLASGEIHEMVEKFGVVLMRSESAPFSLKGEEESLYQIL